MGKSALRYRPPKEVDKARNLCGLGKATIAMRSMEVLDDLNPEPLCSKVKRSMWARAGHSSSHNVTLRVGSAKVIDERVSAPMDHSHAVGAQSTRTRHLLHCIPPRSHGPGGPKERWHRVGFIGLSPSPLIVNTISLTAHISRPGPFHRCTTDRHLGFVAQSAMPFLVPQHVATTPRQAIGVRQCQLHHFSTFRSTPATFTVQVIPGPNSHHSQLPSVKEGCVWLSTVPLHSQVGPSMAMQTHALPPPQSFHHPTMSLRSAVLQLACRPKTHCLWMDRL